MNRIRNRFGILLLLTLCVCLCAAAVSGFAEPDLLSREVVHNPDGSITIIPDDDEENPGGETVELPPPDPTRPPVEGEDWADALEGVANLNGAETPTYWTDPVTGETVPVTVVYMGIGRSMVILNEEKTLVNTVDLKWQTEAPEDRVLAVVDAPRVGYAWLRKQPNNKITNLKIMQVRTDSVVRVISSGDNWTMVDYNGMRAYVKTSALEFFNNDHTEFDSGVVSVKGRITGKDTVHVRSRDDGCRDLGEYKIGTPVTVFDIIDEWAEVDIGGWHCRILAKYVTLERELASAD
jgi:hypothetical protein